ncbi:cytochrome d ubiquinol oxidase subunit II [Pullulanibacillus sp. KACC 23026]|uniref:cytochrome d ubiquinol oxidase subunit II n=1 Tax=Pullulanibacillus sp. KACC 23026 TaxID=3028315 RepID=UPI0023B1F882|nr:cytochrome d ubiquinol oxidase subunit II [Pullulanibacillus sp. KACC 23026]WEG11761.1 cytochrome d ubiquinol oxidase subunit II [Pullulanibacillus sp. KACC 23026]
MPEWIGMTLFWILLYGYIIVASVDFGAGFFASYETLYGERNGLGEIIQQFLSPFWESISVGLLVIMMAIVYSFSDAARLLGPTLIMPFVFALILLILKGLFFLLSRTHRKGFRLWTLLYGLIGLCLPAVLSSALTVSEGGYLDDQKGRLIFHWSLFLTNFYAWSVVFLSIVSVLYISAMFLAFYATKVKDDLALEKLRGYALFWSGPTVLASALVFVALQQQNPEHFMKSLDEAWMFILSLVCLLGAVTLVFRKIRLGVAFILAALQYFFAFFGYGISHLPYIIYPYIKVKELSSLHGIRADIYFAFIMGLALLFPSLILVFRLVRFRHDYGKKDDTKHKEKA